MKTAELLRGICRVTVACALAFASEIVMGEIVGVATIAEGESYLLREDGYFALTPGVDVDEGDVIQTRADGQVQLEMNDGSILEIGESSELYLSEYELQEDESVENASVSLIKGFLRFITTKVKPLSRYEINTTTATIGIRGTEGIVEADEDASNLLLDEGSVEVFEVENNGELGASRVVQAGEAVARERGKHIEPRNVQQLRSLLPKQFTKRAKRYKGLLKQRGVSPKRLRSLGFEDVEQLLKSNPRVRKQFKQRFQSKLKNPKFRQKIEMQLEKYPDWELLLIDKKENGQKKKGGKQKQKKPKSQKKKK